MGTYYKDHVSERVYDQELGSVGFGLALASSVPIEDEPVRTFTHFLIRGEGASLADAWGDFFRDLYTQVKSSGANIIGDIYWRRQVEYVSVREFTTGETVHRVSARFSLEIPQR